MREQNPQILCTTDAVRNAELILKKIDPRYPAKALLSAKERDESRNGAGQFHGLAVLINHGRAVSAPGILVATCTSHCFLIVSLTTQFAPFEPTPRAPEAVD